METAYATVPVGAHRETHAVRSRGFRRWLIAAYYGLAHRPPAAQPLADAPGALEARTQINGELRDVHIRLAEHDGAIYLDLAASSTRRRRYCAPNHATFAMS